MKITITIEVDDKELKKLFEDEPEEVVEEEPIGEYARFYDDTCPSWINDAEQNLKFLKYQENYSNDRLRAKGYLFLNDVFDMLGMARTKAGQVGGWLYTEDDKDQVSFGIYSVLNRDFVNGHSAIALLNFNARENILDYL